MFESPRSLQEVCIDFICGNVLGLCEVHLGDTSLHSSSTPNSNTVSGKCPYKIVYCKLCRIKKA